MTIKFFKTKLCNLKFISFCYMLINDLLINYVANLDIFVADYFVCLKMRSHLSAVLIRNFIISLVVAL